MKKLSTLVILILAISIISIQNAASTNVSGAISANTTWASGGNPWVVTSNITVNSGVTLTITSGAQIQFNDGFGMTVLGTVTANGALFTSSSASPTAGKWTNISVGNTLTGGSAVAGTLNLTSCDLSYAQTILINNGTLTTSGTNISNFSNYAIYLNGSAPVNAVANLAGGTFNNCGNGAIYMYANSIVTTSSTNLSNAPYGVIFSTISNAGNISMTGGTISGMTQAAIYSYSGGVSSYTNVTVNSSLRGVWLNGGSVTMTGCTVSGCTTPVQYESVSDFVLSGAANNFSGNTNKYVSMNFGGLSSALTLPTINIPYYFGYTFTIYNSGRLVIKDDNIIKFNYGSMYVYGKLIADAAAGKQIFFTSFKDDNLGGDANGDASASAPAVSNWDGIYFNDQSIDSACLLRRVTIKFSYHGVDGNNASPTLDLCTFSNNYHGVYIANASYPVISACTFGSSSLTPIAITFDADPVFTSNVFSFQDNQYDAIGLIGSNLSTNAVLKIRGVTSSPNVTYVLLGDIMVPQSRSLTINKGVVIKSYNGYKLVIEGALFANGSADSTIIITSTKDDNAGSPGDTNKDGTQSSPSKGDNGGIVFAPGSLNSSLLNYCDIRFASLPWYTYYSNETQYSGAITIVNASPTISNCKISNCNIGIMCYQASNPVITSNQVINSSSTPFAVSMSASPTFSLNTFTNAGLLGLGIIGGNVSSNGLLKKQNISGYINITYVLLDDITIASGTNIEVEAGVVIKFVDGRSININGGFKINGTPSSRITFTTVKDDNVGNPFDTNGDGNATLPASGNWCRVNYGPTSDDVFSAIRCADFKFGGSSYSHALRWDNAAAPMDNCTFGNSNGSGICIDGASTPVIDSVVLNNGTSDPIAMSLTSDPTFTNITFNANGSRGIRIIEGLLSSNATLKKRSLAGIANITYRVNTLTIDNTATLTIQPGVVIKSEIVDGRAIVINGALIANGTATEKIVFTSTRDDSNGGDYNNDGNTSSPGKDDWSGLYFNSSSLASNLKNCIFRYGGRYYWYYYENYPYEGMITFNNANLVTIDSSLIEQSSKAALCVFGGSTSTLKNTQFLNIDNTPVKMSMFSNPVLTNISLSNVRDIGLGIISETYSQNATVPVRNFGGYTNITYIGLGTFNVIAGTTITVPDGIVFKGGNWNVKGKLVMAGKAIKPIVFTSIADDAFGNPADTRADGSLQSPYQYPVDGSAIQFEDISDDASSVKNTIFRYYSTGITCLSASPVIDSCLFQHSNNGISLAGVSQPVLNNSKFDNMEWGYYQNNAGFPIVTSVLSYPSSTLNNTISGTRTYKGIKIATETLSQDVTLVKRTFAGIPNIPYIFSGFTVGSGASLTLAPGLVCKFINGGMYVNKGLIAEGGATADSQIVFTSIDDDFYGGDTNADSSYSVPSVNGNEWDGIIFENQSIDALCRLKNIVSRYAYYGTRCISANPAISNSLYRNNSYGLTLEGSANPVVNFCDFVSNYYFGIQNVDKSFTVNAENCWWGDNSGPTHSLNPNGTGDKVTDAVDYTPFRTIEAQNPMMGDVSLNGKVQSYDAALVLQSAAALITLNSIQSRVSDVSGSAGTTAFDASLILQYVVGQIRTFPAEELFKTLPVFPAFAKLKMENKDVNAGEEILIPVSLSDVTGMKAFDIRIEYPTDRLQLISLENGEYLNGMNLQRKVDENSGLIYLSAASVDECDNSGLVVYLRFRVRDDAPSGIALLEVSRFLANEDDMLVNTEGGTINITNPALGISSATYLKVEPAYPNPFSETLTVPFLLRDGSSTVQVEIQSIYGERILSTTLSGLGNGLNKYEWKAGSGDHGQLQNGTYLVILSSGNDRIIRKAVLVK